MIGDYKVIRSVTLHKLEELVRDALAHGWEPQGAPFLCAESREWCAAIVRPQPSEVLRGVDRPKGKRLATSISPSCSGASCGSP